MVDVAGRAGEARLQPLARPRVVGAVDKDRGVVPRVGQDLVGAQEGVRPAPGTGGGAAPGRRLTQIASRPAARSTRASATCAPMQSPSGRAWPTTAIRRPARASQSRAKPAASCG